MAELLPFAKLNLPRHRLSLVAITADYKALYTLVGWLENGVLLALFLSHDRLHDTYAQALVEERGQANLLPVASKVKTVVGRLF